MREVCRTSPWNTFVAVRYLLVVGVVIAAAPALVAQNPAPLPSAPTSASGVSAQQGIPGAAPQTGPAGAVAPSDSGAQPIAEPTGPPESPEQTGPRSGSSFHPRPGAAGPFGLPRSISKTEGGVKFQLALPRLSLAGGGRSMGGQMSPLDSGGAQSLGGSGSSAMFPSAGGSAHLDGIDGGAGAGMGGGLPRGGGGGGQAGGLSVSVPGKSSMFDMHLSMKDVIGGSFVGSSGGGGGSTAGTGAGAFGLSGGEAGGASDFGGAGGARGGGKGAGAKMSLGLRF